MNILKFIDTIYKISPKAKQALLQIINEKQFAKNELVQPPDSSCRTVYFVKSGSARIFYYKDGNDITEHFAFANDIIVRAESLFTGQTTVKGIETLSETVLLTIDANTLFQLYDVHHEIERLFRLIFEKEYVNTIRRIESLQFQTATERYLQLLKTTDLIQKIQLKHIASYLGITQVSLSRIRATLK
ncbi:Crp/Fnr family transcriptional regulator [Aureispira anguillae]|uniref:Crp/Fnr family transcriptional regulator n=1 Tax=Aureispira anguillae TaxID=2864201 RepID=A0A915YC67_9BACT|nr:Crp/Fnr family transcriptional regulator [Aureispira anguillae]BDS10403.1 Crp/Fnr family transcriptional regulator [Aureispira anguillae]